MWEGTEIINHNVTICQNLRQQLNKYFNYIISINNYFSSLITSLFPFLQILFTKINYCNFKVLSFKYY